MFNKNIRKTGFGTPITKETLHKCETFVYNGFKLNFYDTKGIEHTHTSEWLNNIEIALKSYEESYNIADWFHAVFYCISAATNRIEPFEIELINRILMPVVGRVHIVITQSDSIHTDQLKQFEKTINDRIKFGNKTNKLLIFKTCSVNKIKRNGEVIETFGKIDLLDSIFRIFWDKVTEKLPRIIITQYEEILNDYFSKIYCELNDVFESTYFYNLKTKSRHLNIILDKKTNYTELNKKIKNQDKITRENLQEAKKLYEEFYNVIFNEKIVIYSISIGGVFDFLELSKLDKFENIKEVMDNAKFPLKTKKFRQQFLINLQYIYNRMERILIKYKKNGVKENELRKVLESIAEQPERLRRF